MSVRSVVSAPDAARFRRVTLHRPSRDHVARSARVSAMIARSGVQPPDELASRRGVPLRGGRARGWLRARRTIEARAHARIVEARRVRHARAQALARSRRPHEPRPTQLRSPHRSSALPSAPPRAADRRSRQRVRAQLRRRVRGHSSGNSYPPSANCVRHFRCLQRVGSSCEKGRRVSTGLRSCKGAGSCRPSTAPNSYVHQRLERVVRWRKIVPRIALAVFVEPA